MPPCNLLLAGLLLAPCVTAFQRAPLDAHGRRLHGVKRAPSHMRMRPPVGSGAHAAATALNVLDFGATPSACPANSTSPGAKDNTAAFQAALNAAAKQHGGAVLAPSGCYYFGGSLSLPPGVTLQGSFGAVPSHSHVPAAQVSDGTVLSPCGGRGDEAGEPFITVNENSALSGVTIFHTEQENVATPAAYPWSVYMTGNNGAVTDVELLNSFLGINATGAHRHYIARVQGQPIKIGVFVDATYDIGRIEDVHFNPWYSDAHPFIEYQLTHGRAFVLGRSDWEYVFNTFAFGYAIGYHFIDTPTGQMNGNFLGIGADLSINASVQVDASQAAGILITNGEFTAFRTDQWLPNSTVESSQVVVGAGNAGPVRFVNSAFWGPSSQIAHLNGTGTVSFSSCSFVQWDLQAKDGRAAIRAFDGNLILQNNDFDDDKTQVELGANLKKAVIVGNVMNGKLRVVDHGAKNVQQTANAFDA